MANPKPKVYFAYGNDEFAMAEFVLSMKSMLGDDSTADMNTLTFSAKDLDWPAFESAASSIPFLSSRRLIILDHVESFSKDTAQSERLIELFEQIPESTALLAMERYSNRSSQKPSMLHEWATRHPDLCYLRACTTPEGPGFTTWLIERATEDGGSIEPEAAGLLAEWTQEDPRLAAQELRKLLDYVDLQRSIQVEDVEQCTPYRGQSSIFALVDAIGQRQGELAVKTLYQVLQEEDIGYAFAMILRQFRLILLAREQIDSGQTPGKRIHRSDFVVKKVAAQARNFSLADLERIYHELLEIDLRSKNGEMALDVGLDRFVSLIAS